MFSRRLVPILLAAAVTSATACRSRPKATPEPLAVPAPAPRDDAAERAAADARDRAERERLERERHEAEHRRVMEAVIYFDYDRSDLSAQARSTLDAKLGVLAGAPSMRIRVSGHTDDRGSDEYNIALGQRRAAAAKRYLAQRGIDGGRIDIVSFGEEQPACTAPDASCWAQNRRDEFQVTAGGLVPGPLSLPVVHPGARPAGR